jgi:hypothetical protein
VSAFVFDRGSVLGAIYDASGVALSAIDPLPDTLIAVAEAEGLTPIDLRLWIYDLPQHPWTSDELRAWARRLRSEELRAMESRRRRDGQRAGKRRRRAGGKPMTAAVPRALRGRVQPAITMEAVRKRIAYDRALDPPRIRVSQEQFDQLVYDTVWRSQRHASRAVIVRWAEKNYEVKQ